MDLLFFFSNALPNDLHGKLTVTLRGVNVSETILCRHKLSKDTHFPTTSIKEVERDKRFTFKALRTQSFTLACFSGSSGGAYDPEPNWRPR